MPVPTRRAQTLVILAIVFAAAIGGCAAWQKPRHYASSVVEYLYPDKAEPLERPTVPVLNLPMKVAIAFVPEYEPGRAGYRPYSTERSAGAALSETEKMRIMERVVAEFREYEFVRSITVIPSAYLRPRGSFANLDQIRTMYGVDAVALLSYDQVQFTDEGLLSLTYWTLVGAYVVRGEKNDTQTMMDAAVYHIPSRKMLFRAPGTSHVKGSATPINLSEELRADSKKGFEEAARGMTTALKVQLDQFTEHVKASPQEFKVVQRGGAGGGTGGGAVGLDALALIGVLLGLWAWRRNG